MGMHYVRPPGQDFVVNIPRVTARDANLSYRARGVLQRLLSNAEGFSMTAEDLAREGREGRDAIRAALRELKNAGYIVQHATTNAAGQFTGTDAYVYSTPQAGVRHREPENPLAGNPPAGLPTLKSSKSSKQRDRSSSTRERVPAPPQAAHAAAAFKSTKQHKAPGTYHGVRIHAGTDDVQRVDACIQKRGVEWVEAFAADRLPLPSEVEQAIAADARRAQRRDYAAMRAGDRPNHVNHEADAAAFAATLAGLEQEKNQ